MSNPTPACPAPSTADLERSTRWPVLLLLYAAAKWLVAASALGFLATLKCHAPEILADVRWLTYGRLQPAAWNALVYGFGLQGGMAVILLLLVQLGRARLAFPGAVVAGSLFWNLGVVLGVLGILAGGSTGQDNLEFPGSAAAVLLVAYLLVALGALGTFRARREAELYPSQWFLLVAVFWFPWAYSAAVALVAWVPARGIMQSVAAWWYGAQLTWVWFAFVTLALLWYLIPRAVGRDLYSRYHAMLAFWLLVLLSGWRGIPHSAPVPAWMPGLSTVAGVLSVVAWLAVLLNLHGTLAGRYGAAWATRTGRLALLSAIAFLLAQALSIAGSMPAVSAVTDLTFFPQGVVRLLYLGGFGLALFALLYEVAPRWADGWLPSRSLAALHLGCFGLGAAFQALPAVLWGVAHGRSLNEPHLPIMDALQPGLMALRLGTLGELLVCLGGLALVANFLLGAWKLCRTCCFPVVAAAWREEPAEASR